MQDVALAGQDVVVHVDPTHRGEMAPDDLHRDCFSHLRRLVVALFDLLQPLRAGLVFGIVLFVKTRRLGVEVPAVEIELSSRMFDQRPNFGEGSLLDVDEPHDDVGHLHAGVIDIVLDLNLTPCKPKDSDEGVSDHGVSQMADMSCLVRVDVRVLDDNLAVRLRKPLESARPELVHRASERPRPVEEEVDVARPGDLDSLNPIDLKPGRELFGNRPRSFLQLLGKSETQGRRQFAEFDVRCLVEDDFGSLDVPQMADRSVDTGLDPRLKS